MSSPLRRILSHDSGPFWQFAKYGAIGVMATVVQYAVFYALAATCMRCLGPDDWAVRFAGLPSVVLTDGERALLATAATGIGFAVANVFCWLMNRRFVFRPGRFPWPAEFAMFFGAAAGATALALFVQWILISCFGMMTSLSLPIEVAVSFAVNYFTRKFVIFKG